MRFVGERLLEHALDDVQIEIQQRRNNTDVGDVLHQNAGACTVEGLIAHPRQRHAEHGDVFAVEQCRARPRRVVDQPAAGRYLRHVLRVGLRIHRDHDVAAIGTRLISVTGDADLVPGRQPLDVRREVVLADNRYAHPEDRLAQETVGARRTGAVYRGDLEDDIVDGRHSLSFSSRRRSICGQRGAQSRRLRRAAESLTSACPMPLSGSVRRTGCSARTGLRL